jgi:hypothetical protein
MVFWERQKALSFRWGTFARFLAGCIMKPIEPLVIDIDAYIGWTNRTGDYLESLMESRENAISLLRHNEAAVRIAAIKSFLYCWYVDKFVVELFHHLSIHDPDRFVRCTSSYCLMTMRLRCDRKRPSSNRTKKRGRESLVLTNVARSYSIIGCQGDNEERLAAMCSTS